MSMTRPHALPARPCVLLVAGLDPSGGAGLAADVRAVHAAGAWPCPVAASLTVQSTAGLARVRPVPSPFVIQQAREVLAHQRVRAVKTGALASAANARSLALLAREHPRIPLVVDPVLVPTRARARARLLDARALGALRELLAVAAVATPNALEAAALLGVAALRPRDLEDAARALLALGPRAVLLKGGHVPGRHVVDLLALAGRLVRLPAPRIDTPGFHGGGCTLASLVAGRLALEPRGTSAEAIEAAVRWSVRRVRRAIRGAVRVGEGLLVCEP
jgi:hydroxymethylpyrimidine/phosphomethylpyrimidine kinase